MRPEDRSARREVSACGTALYGLLPVPATWLWCPQPWPSPAFWHWGGEVQKPQAESRALTRTRCPFQAPRFSCFLLEVLGQACFLSRSDCTEGSIIFASRFTFKKQNVTVCVCVRFHFFEYCPECYGSVLRYMRWYTDCSIFHRSWH